MATEGELLTTHLTLSFMFDMRGSEMSNERIMSRTRFAFFVSR